MNIKECYQEFGGEFEDVLGRFMNEDRVIKFALKFLNDKSLENLKTALKSEDYDEAFRAAHTLKGICQNLSFTRLYKSSSELTEKLRNKNIDGCDKLLEQVIIDYNLVADTLNKLDN